MNWGWKLAIASALFMSLIIYFVVQSFYNQTQLVSDNYYEEELQFQQQIDAAKNASDLNDTLFVTQHGAEIIIDYPDFFSQNLSEGTVHFYKPSNENHDKKFKFSPNDGKQIMISSEIMPGRYQVKFDLTSNGKKYFYDKFLIVQ